VRNRYGGPGPGGDATPVARGYLGIEELAAYTGLSVSTLRRLWRRGRITGFQPGGPRTRVVFPPDAIEQAVRLPPDPRAGTPARPADAPRRGPRPKWLGGLP
jgi:excisionase family DNA binding protein